jgi:hypothetical protein
MTFSSKRIGALLIIIANLCQGKKINRVRRGDVNNNKDNGRQRQQDLSAERLRSAEELYVWDRSLMSSSMSMGPTSTLTPAPTGRCKLTEEERRDQLLEIMIGVSEPEDLEEEGTPQYKAFEWLVVEDSYHVCPVEHDCSEKAISRYVAALLYYSTNGDDWVNCSADSDDSPCDPDGIIWDPPFSELHQSSSCFEGKANRWLSEFDECTWCGLSCDDEEDLESAFFILPPDFPGCYLSDIKLGESLLVV